MGTFGISITEYRCNVTSATKLFEHFPLSMTVFLGPYCHVNMQADPSLSQIHQTICQTRSPLPRDLILSVHDGVTNLAPARQTTHSAELQSSAVLNNAIVIELRSDY